MEYETPDGEYYEWYVNTLLELTYLLNNFGDLIENVTDDSYSSAVDAWIYSIDLHTPLYKQIGFLTWVNMTNILIHMLKKYISTILNMKNLDLKNYLE